jgi:ribosomal-protein-alanine N-acetyltransferase
MTAASETDSIRIRPMTPADLDVMYPYEVEMFGSEAWSKQSYLEEIADTELRDYIVAERGEILGSAGLMTVGETAQILTVAVLPPQRRQGIGRILVRALVDLARGRLAEELLLEVRIDNDGAKKLYEDEGFSVLSVRRGYYDHGRVDALVMRLGLTN